MLLVVGQWMSLADVTGHTAPERLRANGRKLRTNDQGPTTNAGFYCIAHLHSPGIP